MKLRDYISKILSDCSHCTEIKIEVCIDYDINGEIIVDNGSTNKITISFKKQD